MTTNLVASASTEIEVLPSEVWKALITPEMIKEYLFGTNAESEWKVGSPITYSGEWEGKTYVDKGEILEFEPEKRFVSTYWSAMSGLPDEPGNYSTVTYQLEPTHNGTRIGVTQTNVKDEEARSHSEHNWAMVLESMKKLLEG